MPDYFAHGFLNCNVQHYHTVLSPSLMVSSYSFFNKQFKYLSLYNVCLHKSLLIIVTVLHTKSKAKIHTLLICMTWSISEVRGLPHIQAIKRETPGLGE
jgi:hypothetical protein